MPERRPQQARPDAFPSDQPRRQPSIQHSLCRSSATPLPPPLPSFLQVTTGRPFKQGGRQSVWVGPRGRRRDGGAVLRHGCVSRLVCARAVEKRLRWPLAHPSRCRRQCSLVCSPVPLFLLQPIHFQPRHSPLRLECFLNYSTPVLVLDAASKCFCASAQPPQIAARVLGFSVSWPNRPASGQAVGERSSEWHPSRAMKEKKTTYHCCMKGSERTVRSRNKGVEINTQAARDQGQHPVTAHARAGGDAECAVWRGPLMARVSPLSGRHRCVGSSSCREKKRVAARGSSAG